MLVGSVVIVTYNSAQCVQTCMRALGSAAGWETVLVDNASSDGTVEIVRRVAPNIRVLRNPNNRGFAAAVNQGIKAAAGEIAVILNPDTVATEGALDRLARVLAGDSKAGAVGGSLRKRDGLVERGFTVRRFPTLGSAIAEALLLNRAWGNNPWNRRYRCLDLDYNRLQEVDQPAGACLAISREAWKDVGGFDEAFYPVWFEDVDFCRRLRDRGWKILYCPEAAFTHAGGHSVGKLTFKDRQAFWYGNLLRYFRKHFGAPQVTILQAAIVAGLVLRSGLAFTGLHPGVSLREAVSAYKHAAWEHGILGRGTESNNSALRLPAG